MKQYLLTRSAVALTALCALGLAAAPWAAVAAPFHFTIQGLEAIDVAQRDSDGNLRSFEAEDDNSDGTISFVADLDPIPIYTVYVHIQGGAHRSELGCFAVQHPRSHMPFFVTGSDDRVITRWLDLPTIEYSLGQVVSVVDGQLAGLDAVVHVSPGIASAAEAVDVDIPSLPLYTGPLNVGGLVTIQLIPEPTTAPLIVAVCVTATLTRRRAPLQVSAFARLGDMERSAETSQHSQLAGPPKNDVY